MPNHHQLLQFEDLQLFECKLNISGGILQIKQDILRHRLRLAMAIFHFFVVDVLEKSMITLHPCSVTEHSLFSL